MFSLTPLINHFNQFSQIQSNNQQQQIALLRTISQQLAEISQQIKQINYYEIKSKSRN